jgi:hypothetical protein
MILERIKRFLSISTSAQAPSTRTSRRPLPPARNNERLVAAAKDEEPTYWEA